MRRIQRPIYSMAEGDAGGGGEGAGEGEGAGGAGTPGGEGSGTPAPPTGWQAGLGADLSNHELIKTYEDTPAGLLKLSQDRVRDESVIRRKGVIMPNFGDKEDVARFNTEVGCPAKSTDYDLGKIEVSDTARASMEQSGQLQPLVDLMHTAGLRQDQVESLYGGYLGMFGGYIEGVNVAAKNLADDHTARLRTAWGNKYDTNIEQGDRALLSGAGGEISQELKDLKFEGGIEFTKHPAVQEIFARLGGQMAEGGMIGDKQNQMAPMTPEVAKLKLVDFEKENKEAIFVDRTAPNREAILRQWHALQDAASAGAA